MDLKRGDSDQKELDFSSPHHTDRVDTTPCMKKKALIILSDMCVGLKTGNMGEFLRLLDEGKVAFFRRRGGNFRTDYMRPLQA